MKGKWASTSGPTQRPGAGCTGLGPGAGCTGVGPGVGCRA